MTVIKTKIVVVSARSEMNGTPTTINASVVAMRR